MIIRGLVLLLLVWLAPCNSLLCYECGCDHTNMSACDCGTITTSDEPDYCIIGKERYENETYVQLARQPRNATWVYAEDPYFLFTVQSVRYNKSSSSWYTFQSGIAYACDWDLCNSPDMISRLPLGYTATIESNWLNTNILGSGSVSQCNDCHQEFCGSAANPPDFGLCPMSNCTNSTTCLAYVYWEELSTDRRCHGAQCIPMYLDDEYADYYGSRQRIEISVMLYLQGSRSRFDIWEIDVYCSANNCTRSTIFDEVRARANINAGDLSPFPTIRPTTTQPPPTTKPPLTNAIKCYDCQCVGTSGCTCDSTIEISTDDTYCIVARENRGQQVVLTLGELDYYATYNYILDAPFVVVEETISYDESGGFWITTTDLIIYGCGWNLCNKPSLIPLLPNSFQMRLPESWLNKTILGSGQSMRKCHECPDSPQCGPNQFLDPKECPIKDCNTTCFVQDSFNDPAYNFFCYQSYCLSTADDQPASNHHRVEIEGLVYASDPTTLNIWEIDLYCRGDDCSNPNVFKELRSNLNFQIGTLNALFNETHDPSIPQRRCYNCDCYNDLVCGCNKIAMKKAEDTYCIVLREDYGQDNWITMGHITEDSTRFQIRDLPYLLMEEYIHYNVPSGVWITGRNFVLYGCDWDLCNDPNLIPLLPNSFEMRLPEAWLNTNIRGNGPPIRSCPQCLNDKECSAVDSIDTSKCPSKLCNTTCMVSDLYDDPASGEFCYSSYCAEFGSADAYLNNARVEIEGILYLEKQPREIELWDVDLYCRAEDCSRSAVFKELAAELTLQLGDVSAFEKPKVSTITPTSPTSPTSAASILISTQLLTMVSTFMLVFRSI